MNLIKGDKVKVLKLNQTSKNSLTLNKEYTVLRLKLKDEYYTGHKPKFYIKNDKGVIREYGINNTMFEKVKTDEKRSLSGTEIHKNQVFEIKMPYGWDTFKITRIRATNVVSNLQYDIAVTFTNDNTCFDENIKNVIGNTEFILKQ